VTVNRSNVLGVDASAAAATASLDVVLIIVGVVVGFGNFDA